MLLRYSSKTLFGVGHSRWKEKEDIKKLWTKFMDMKHLEMSYDGLINETVSNEDLIKRLKNISEAILSCRKKTAASKFAERQWKLSVTPKRRPCRLPTADRADHADCRPCRLSIFFFLILVFAYTFDLHFFGPHHKIEFNYMSECFLFVTIYRRATQARYVTVDSILTSAL